MPVTSGRASDGANPSTVAKHMTDQAFRELPAAPLCKDCVFCKRDLTYLVFFPIMWAGIGTLWASILFGKWWWIAVPFAATASYVFFSRQGYTYSKCSRLPDPLNMEQHEAETSSCVTGRITRRKDYFVYCNQERGSYSYYRNGCGPTGQFFEPRIKRRWERWFDKVWSCFFPSA